MKATTQPSPIEAPGITYNPELDKCDDVVLFPNKMEKARAIIARAGLPGRPAPKRPT